MRSIFIFGILIILYGAGCDDAGIVKSGKTVSGRVVDEYGFTIAGARIKIGENETQSASDGTFIFNEVSYPYNVKVFLLGSPTRAYYFENLNLSQPVLTLFGAEGNYNTAEINVNIPPMNGQERAYVIFSDMNSVQTGAVIVQPNSSVNFTVSWKPTGQIYGKVMVLIVNYINGAALSYEKFGEKSLILTSNSSYTVNFVSSDLLFNPGENTVSGNLIIPSGAVSPRIDLQLNFKSGGSLVFPFTSGTTVSFINGTNFNLILPSDIPFSPRLVLAGSAAGSDVHELTTATLIYASHTSGFSINLYSFPVLISPDNFATDVNYNTNFSISQSEGNFVYVYTFDGNDRVFYLITRSTQVRIPDFRDMGLGIASSHSYEWWVNGYGDITSNDEFLGYDLPSNTALKNYISSTNRSFSTSP